MSFLDKLKLLWGRRSALIMLIIGVLLAMSPNFFNEFSNWDDDVYLTDNPLVKQLSWHSVFMLFTSFHSGLYKPLVLLSFALEYHFAGLDPFIYHFTNVLIHLVNCLLVFLIMERLTDKLAVVFGVALLFGIHPMHVESVAWVSERKDMLYSLFFLLAMQQYLRYRDLNSKWSYWVSVGAMLVSLTAKPMGVTFPIVLLLLDYHQGRKLDRELVLDKLPYIVLGGGFGLLAYFSVSSSHALVERYDFTFWDNICVGFYGLLLYLWRFFVPTGLSCLYPYPEKINEQLPFIYAWAPSFALMALTLLFYCFRKDRKSLFGLLFFLATVSLGLQWIPLAPSVAFDHYAYISYFGLFYILCDRLYALYQSGYFQASERRRVYFLAVCLFLSVLLGTMSFYRSRVWRNPITLWTNVLDKYENATAYSNRGAYFMKKGEYARALYDFNQAIRVNPYMAEAYVNRGSVYSQFGQLDRSLAENQKAMRLRPFMYQPEVNIALIYSRQGRYKEALSILHSALEKNPMSPELYANRASVYVQLKKYAAAEVELRKSLVLNPRSANAYANLANLMFTTGHFKEAAEYYAQAAAYGTEFNAELYHNRGIACVYSDNLQCALDSFSKALILDPGNLDVLLKRATVATNMKLYTQALSDYTYALRISTAVPDGYVGRAFLYLNLEKPEQAVLDFQRAGELSPNSPVIAGGLGASFFLLRQLPEAESAFSRTIALDPKNPQNYFNRARVYEFSGKYPKAMADLKKSLELAPKYDRALVMAAAISRKTGNYKAGLDYANKAVAMNDKNPMAYQERGLLLAKTSSCVAAVPDLNKALSLDKSLKDASDQLAACKH